MGVSELVTLLHADGFDHYGPNGLGANQIYAAAGGAFMNDGTARTGSTYFRCNGYQNGLHWTFPEALSRACVACGFRVQGLNPSGSFGHNDPYLGFVMSSGNWVSIAVGSNGQIVLSLNSTVIAQSNPKVIAVSTWYWLEMQMDNSNQNAPTLTVQVNGVPVLEYEGAIDVGTIAQTISNQSFSSIWDLDDYVVTDGDFPGDRRCFTIMPNGAGDKQDWTVTGADNAWDAVGAIPGNPNNYIEATEAGQQSTFSLQALEPNISSVLGICVYSSQQKTDAGDANTSVGIVSGIGENDGVSRPLGVGFTMVEDIFSANPVTQQPYTPNDVYAAQVSIKRTV